MKKIYSFFAALIMSVAAMASNVEVFTHTMYGGTDGTNMRTYTTENFTLIQKKGPAKGDSWVEDMYDDLRLYKNQTLTITAGAAVGTIDSVIINLNIVKQKAEIGAIDDNTYTTTVGSGKIVASLVSYEENKSAVAKLTATGQVNEFIITATSQQFRIVSMSFYYSDKVAPTPVLKASTELVDFGTVAVGNSQTQTVNIEGYNLTEDIVFTETEKASAISYTPQLTRNGGSIVINLDASKTGEYTGAFTVSANGLKCEVIVGASVVGASAENDGSKEHPYTVDDVLTLNNSLAVSAWVEGYIWGVVKSAHALQDTYKDNNSLALGATANVPADEQLDFVAVQIKDQQLRSELGLMTNPKNAGRHIKVYGKLEAYFSTAGVKEISDYEWLDDAPVVEPVHPTSVELSATELKLQTGEKYTLTATVLPADAENKSVSWSSSDNSVATVADGVVTAVAEGQTTITVKTTDGGLTATCVVTVSQIENGLNNADIKTLVRTTDNGIEIIGDATDAKIYNVTGKLISRGERFVSCQQGIYIISIGNQTAKIVK